MNHNTWGMEDNIQALTELLDRKNIAYARREGAFVMLLPVDRGDLLDVKLSMTVRTTAICVNAYAPVTSLDTIQVGRLLNRMNCQQRRGIFQYDCDDGELRFTQFVSSNGEWAGDETVMNTIQAGIDAVCRLAEAVENELNG
ncbi:MAG: hypothetical protein IJE08_01355 [Clostridia bacterium]|nr:hypothetical protein [Clostridia bacterium]